MASVLGYWKLRGLAQSIRLLLAHADQDFEDKYYHFGPGPEFSNAEWLEEKFTLGLEFPNLPYYIEGDTKITQSGAIIRYLADKHQLNPSTEEEKRRVYVVEYQIRDFHNALSRLAYDDNYENLKEGYIKTIPESLKLFSDFIENHKWLAGDKLTYVDFMLYEILQRHNLFSPGCLDEFSSLTDYIARFESLPNISKYIKSDKFIKGPIYAPSAKFNT